MADVAHLHRRHRLSKVTILGFFEGIGTTWRYAQRQAIAEMSRAELVEWLEFRGMACYDDESTELLRETALEDYDEEQGNTA